MGEQKLATSDDECLLGDGEEDCISSSVSCDESFTISRQLSVDDSRMKKISYSLVGVQDDNAQDEHWQGFNGPAVVHVSIII